MPAPEPETVVVVRICWPLKGPVNVFGVMPDDARRRFRREQRARDSGAGAAGDSGDREVGQAAAAAGRSASAGGRGRRLRGGHHVGLRDRERGGLSLKRGRRPDLQRAAPGRRQSRRGRATERIGRGRQRAHAVERRTAFLDRKPDDRTGHRLIVAIAHFDDRRDRRFLLNDIDRAFAFEHDDLQRGALSGLRRRIGQPRPQRRAARQV